MPKLEFPPLLSAGFHGMSTEDLRKLCVGGFKTSVSRPHIMDGFQKVVEKLRGVGIQGEVWVDGSFLTKKIEPFDADILVHVSVDFTDAANQTQKNALRWVNANLRADYRCDSYILVTYPAGHALHSDGEWSRAYWLRQYGFDQKTPPGMKGIALIKL
jgi:hypothetical protein